MSNTLSIKKLREITHHLVYGNETAVNELMDVLREEQNCDQEFILLDSFRSRFAGFASCSAPPIAI